ncbi:hypothetical protein PPERSA_00360 [Pseudocohnilembus persalinus]|uniref:Uncharacterized protein n=1 Tax=Pseudocohnilembus persalinus TaxID=266149 RepID=A0A0V0QXX1_PSEPJ|nr:hypothetical protein PPERSA_00360 [Pseudocohnilembus persalinus]|eukprot:KRX07203.1 hypothetical protein PPERSA_00360 [Pseudocohnilembus persalinus]
MNNSSYTIGQQTLNPNKIINNEDLYTTIRNQGKISPSPQKDQIRYSPYNLAKQAQYRDAPEGENISIFNEKAQKILDLTNELNKLTNKCNELQQENSSLKDRIIYHLPPNSKFQKYKTPEQVKLLEEENKYLLDLERQYKFRNLELKKYINRNFSKEHVEQLQKLWDEEEKLKEKLDPLVQHKKQVESIRSYYQDLERGLHQKAIELQNRNTHLAQENQRSLMG